VTEEKEMVKVRLEKLDGTVMEKLVEKPIYGGSLTLGWAFGADMFDDAMGLIVHGLHGLVWEVLEEGDWARGPTGTGEYSWLYGITPPKEVMRGALAESWELTDSNTLVYHIRKGVHFHDKPPTNGREMTADDVLLSLKRVWETPGSYLYSALPASTHIESMTAPDKWTVVVKCLPGKAGALHSRVAGFVYIVPREVIEEYGDINDWRNSCGTGPFRLVDFVADSAATLVKNPNYWMNDPIHPENRLPYLDEVRFLFIPDPSTRVAAVRTRKIDQIPAFSDMINWEDAEDLVSSVPGLKHLEALYSTCPGIAWRVDKPELPFYDKRVRHALYMAIDNQAIMDSIQGGHGGILTWPIMAVPEFMDIYIPLEELPQSTRELYEYHPDKAKQLLAEAGYPDGFETEIICMQESADLLSIVKDYWAKVGVDLEIRVKEGAIVYGMGIGRRHEEMILMGGDSAIDWDKFTRIGKGMPLNFPNIDDPVIEEAKAAIEAEFFDHARKKEIFKGVLLHILDQAYWLMLPPGVKCSVWQPWIKAYHGEKGVGYLHSFYNFPKYCWIDRDLKEEITGRR